MGKFLRYDESMPEEAKSSGGMPAYLIDQGVRIVSVRRDPSLPPECIDIHIEGTLADCHFGSDCHSGLMDVITDTVPASKQYERDRFRDAVKKNKPILFGLRMVNSYYVLEPLGVVEWP